ncbi:hypothetical protein ACIQF5_01595 [Streptomyces goshikiensis]
MRRRIPAVPLALLATQPGSPISPAYACGRRAMIPDRTARIGS